jgi:hypothetical protein
MQENKDVVQEALIRMKQVEDVIAENAKGILASTMKEEINQLVKESLSEQDDDEVELDVDMDDDTEEVDMDMDIDNEDEVEMDMDLDMTDMDSESPIDLTNASDEEILKVFKAMGEEDGIIVKKDGKDIHLTDNNSDNEYLVKLGESMEEEMDEQEEDEYEEEEMDESSHYGGKKGDISKSRKDYMEEDEDVDAVIEKLFSSDSDDSEGMDVEDEDEEIMYEIEFDEQDDDDMDSGEELYPSFSSDGEFMGMSKSNGDMNDVDEMEMDEQNWEESLDEAYSHKKAPGITGNGPKFSYNKSAKGGFKEDKKVGPKSVGTGKAKFEYKKGANMEGKSKVVKAETKEGKFGGNKGDDSRSKRDYEQKFGGNKGDKSKTHSGKDYEKTETKEAARTYGMGSKEGRGLRKGITNNRNYVYGKNGVKVESLESEVSMLREKNEEYRKALNVFREKLNEVAIFNSNLAYATRLFTEHSTTKKEKINILRRFDGVETLKESKYLYKSIKDELGQVDSKSINESVGNKINNTVSTGSSTTLIESKTYENPQFLRMKDLMTKIK